MVSEARKIYEQKKSEILKEYLKELTRLNGLMRDAVHKRDSDIDIAWTEYLKSKGAN